MRLLMHVRPCTLCSTVPAETPEATRKNLYVRPTDRWIWTRAEQVAGDSLSAFVAEALRSYLRLNQREALAACEAELRAALQMADEAARRADESMAQLVEAQREARAQETPERVAKLGSARRQADLASTHLGVAHARAAQAQMRADQLRSQVDQHEREESDRVVIDLWDDHGYRHQKAFRGHWLLSPVDDFHRTSGEAYEMIWSVAETVKGRFVVYSFDVDWDPEGGIPRGNFEVYESFAQMAEAVPHVIREEIRTRTGRVEVQELDI